MLYPVNFIIDSETPIPTTDYIIFTVSNFESGIILTSEQMQRFYLELISNLQKQLMTYFRAFNLHLKKSGRLV